MAQRPLLSGAGLTKHLQELAKESAATEAHLANRKAMLATAQQRLHVSVRQQEAERLELFHQHMTYLEEAKRHHREQQLGFQRALHERFIKSPTSLELQVRQANGVAPHKDVALACPRMPSGRALGCHNDDYWAW